MKRYHANTAKGLLIKSSPSIEIYFICRFAECLHGINQERVISMPSVPKSSKGRSAQTNLHQAQASALVGRYLRPCLPKGISASFFLRL